MDREEYDTCRSCGEDLEVQYLLMTECGDILCASCMEHHAPCDICFSDDDSDSTYIPEEESEEVSTDESSTEPDDETTDPE
jgi:hypothetical protein